MKELLDAIAAQIARSKPGEVIVTNGDWHEAQIKELRLPTRWDIDPISRNNPVVVIRGGHQYMLNSAALAKWGITKATKSPPGGEIGVDRARGEISGELVDRAATWSSCRRALPRRCRNAWLCSKRNSNSTTAWA